MTTHRATTDFDRFRAGFPGVRNGPYLNVADRGLLSTEVRDAVASYLDSCVSGDNKELTRRWIERARLAFAELVRADTSEIALIKNVSEGINAMAGAIDWRAGDNVVVCGALEHPSNLIPWLNLRDRRGVEVRNVEPLHWTIDPERIVGAIDARTRLVSVSLVTFAPGFRTDIGAIGNACRERNVLFVVDAAQAPGVLDIDLGQSPVDALAVGTPKALLGLYGMGFLFVRSGVAGALRPAYLSGAGVVRDAESDTPLPLKPGAGRFDLGNPNHVGCVAAAASIEQLQRLGIPNIERHAVGMARMLADGLRGLGLPVFTPPRDDLRTNIVCVGTSLEASLDSTSDPRLNSLYAHLSRHHVNLSVRRGVLRFSTHAYTGRDDIAQTLELASDWTKTAPPAL